METAVESRIEATRLRGFIGGLTVPAELAAIEAMIEELEGPARKKDNGGAAAD
jgi:hypothetical protein